MDNTIRRNENCVIGIPSCDYVFSSTRSCFIAYGFDESALEMTILKNLLEARGIEPIEAGGQIAPGENVFCRKICSKIIMSQFCVVLLNNDDRDGIETPNANINMEYGLMLGFNKMVLPFQRESQHLPFNVAGLDTQKYTDKTFEQKAVTAIEHAIEVTKQEETQIESRDQLLDMYLLSNNLLTTYTDNEGERGLFRLGEPLGFNLVNDFSGMNYSYLGRFANLRPELVLWRIRKLGEILKGRSSTIHDRLFAGTTTQEQTSVATQVFANLTLLILVTGDQDKMTLLDALEAHPIGYPVHVVSNEDIRNQVEAIG